MGQPWLKSRAFLNAIEAGDPKASSELLPLVYAELRKLASQRLANENPGKTLQATALVHEAYLRLVGTENGHPWDSRGHFFSAAAEAMRRIMIERLGQAKWLSEVVNSPGSICPRTSLVPLQNSEMLVVLDNALFILEQSDAKAAQVFKLRFFAGLSVKKLPNSSSYPGPTHIGIGSSLELGRPVTMQLPKILRLPPTPQPFLLKKAYLSGYNRRVKSALTQTSITVAGTVEREMPTAWNDNKKFKEFIRKYWPVICAGSLGKHVRNMRVKYAHPVLEPELRGYRTIDQIVYHVLGCRLIHTAERACVDVC